jgi:hypothetical protein
MKGLSREETIAQGGLAFTSASRVSQLLSELPEVCCRIFRELIKEDGLSPAALPPWVGARLGVAWR